MRSAEGMDFFMIELWWWRWGSSFFCLTLVKSFFQQQLHTYKVQQKMLQQQQTMRVSLVAVAVFCGGNDRQEGFWIFFWTLFFTHQSTTISVFIGKHDGGCYCIRSPPQDRLLMFDSCLTHVTCSQKIENQFHISTFKHINRSIEYWIDESSIQPRSEQYCTVLHTTSMICHVTSYNKDGNTNLHIRRN